MVDFHTHILPGVDDGSSSMGESLRMLEEEARQGITQVVLTPHFYPDQDSPERFLARRQNAAAQLQQALAQNPDLPKAVLGAEVYFYPGMSDSEMLKDLTVSGTELLLVEMPQSPWPDWMFRELVRIREKQGLVPVVAHLDRYIGSFRSFGIPERLAELPVLVQANSSFFLNKSTRAMALRLWKRGAIHLLGSDCHNMKNRPPRLGEAASVIQQHLGAQELRQLRQFHCEILRTASNL